MKGSLKYSTLIELFYSSINRPEKSKNVLEIFRTDREESLTFGQLGIEATNFALYLIQKKSIKVGNKIAILGKNRADWDIALWGVILAGGIPVLIDPERRIEGVKKHLLHTECKILIMADDYQDEISRVELKEFASEKKVGLIEMTVYELAYGGEILSLEKLGSKIKAEDTAVILCTSGTTGDPREVELTHNNLISNLQGALEIVKISSEEKFGHIIPPYHSFGLTIAKLFPFLVGATNVYTNNYRQIPNLIRDRKITIFLGVPALFAFLAKRIEEGISKKKGASFLLRLADNYFPKLVGKWLIKELGWQNFRFFASGAAAVPRWVLKVFWKRGLQLREGYGTTENSPLYGFNADPKKLGSVGKPISTLLVKIADEQGKALPPDEKGEILLGGPCVMKGYYKNPQANKLVIETDKNGTRWLHTGDLGYLDNDGDLYITGRKKYIIVLPNGKNVNPELVEAVFSQADYVKEILIVPNRKTDSLGEEAIKAIVLPDWDGLKTKTGFSREDLIKKPETLKDLLWQSINELQQKNQELSAFEKISSKYLLEIRLEDFEKTPIGKIKREVYLPK